MSTTFARFLEGQLVRAAAFVKSAHFVIASWDGEAGVWYVRNSSVPGLSLEAETPAALLNKIEVAVPELLTLNGKSRHIDQNQAIPFVTSLKSSYRPPNLGGWRVASVNQNTKARHTANQTLKQTGLPKAC